MGSDDQPRNETAAEALAAYFRLLAAERGADGSAAPDASSADWDSRVEQAKSCVELLARVWPDPDAKCSPDVLGAGACAGDCTSPAPVRIGKFELVRELGRGAFGVVLLARDTTLGRCVALKLPRPEVLVSDVLRDRFLREARAASRLTHRNLVSVFEAGEAGPICYIAQEYCEGPTLAEWLKDRSDPLPPALAARVVAAPARAVDCAHRHGIVHRDLKPSNVILDGGTVDTATPHVDREELPFTPKVADFGTAKLLEDDGSETRTGALLGTPQYMSPEQADGRLAEIGPQTDVYSLGVILYELLTSQPPFRGETPLDTLRRVGSEEPIAPRHLRPAVPPDLEAVCLKCVEKDPARRYVSAAAMADDLERFLSGAPTIARPLGVLGRAWKWSHRMPTAAALVALTVVVVLGALADGAWHSLTLQTALEIAEQRRLEAQDLEALARSRESEVRHHLYASDMKRADDAWKRSHVALTVELLNRYRGAPATEDLRTFAWHRLWRLCNRHSLELRGHTGDVYWVAYSPDGKSLATAGRDGTARLWDASTGRQLAELRGQPGELSNVCFSPDGLLLATCGDDQMVRLWDRASGCEVATLEGHAAEVFVAAFSPDGSLLATGARDRLIKIWDVQSHRERATLVGHTGGIEAMAFAPDGLLLATGSSDRTVRLWSVAQQREIGTLGRHDGVVLSVCFSPDGRILASGGEDRAIKLWDVEDRREEATLGGHGEVVQSVAFSPDGGLLGAGVKNGVVQFWNVNNHQRSGVLRGHAGRIWCVDFAPDGQRVATASGDGTVRLWEIPTAREGELLATDDFGLRSLAIAGSTQTLVASYASQLSNGSHVDAWSLAERPRQMLWRASGGYAMGAAFFPDEHQIAAAYSRAAKNKTGQRPEVELLDAATGRLVSTVGYGPFGRGKEFALSAMACSPSGTQLSVARDSGRLELWNVAEPGTRQLTGHTGAILSLDYSPDGKILASGADDHTVRLWNVADGRQHALLRGHHGAVRAVSFAPDGRVLATTGVDRTLIFWDMGSGKAVATLEAHAGAVECLAYANDGRTVATGSADGAIKLWDVRTFSEVALWKAHAGPVRALAFSPDERLLASGGETSDGPSEVVLWHAGAPQQ